MKFQRSKSPLLGGKASVTLMSTIGGGGGGGAFSLVSGWGLTVIDGESFAPALGAAAGSWVLRSVSTCSAGRATSAYFPGINERGLRKKRSRT